MSKTKSVHIKFTEENTRFITVNGVLISKEQEENYRRNIKKLKNKENSFVELKNVKIVKRIEPIE